MEEKREQQEGSDENRSTYYADPNIDLSFHL